MWLAKVARYSISHDHFHDTVSQSHIEQFKLTLIRDTHNALYHMGI